MASNLQTLLAGVAVFTLAVLSLSALVLGLRRVLTPMGQVTVVINDQDRITVPFGTGLMAVMASQGIHLPAACGGRGSCGQCGVSVRQGAPPLTAVEASHIAPNEARAGKRLACMLVLRDDLAVHVPESLLSARRWDCTVASVRHITTLMKELVLQLPPGEVIDFHAGAYVLIEAPPHRVRFADFDIPSNYRSEWARHDLLQLQSDCAESTVRAYSLANPPADNRRAVLTARIALPPHDQPEGLPPGRASSWLFSLQPGATVPVSGPFGDFRAMETPREMVLIGGGAGVAPLRSIILDQLQGRETGRRISFWYGARNAREICYRDEFDALALSHPNFTWQAALSEPEPGDGWTGPSGFIHAVVLGQYLEQHTAPEDIEYYICGPPLMNVAVLQMLEDLGVDRESIFLDDFGASI